MNKQDTILDEITGKQLIWCGHVERLDTTRLSKIMINWKPEGRKKQGRPPEEPGKMWYIYSTEWKRSKNGRMEQSKAIECGSRQASTDVLKLRNIYRCPRRNVPDFGRVFLMLRYTDITQNTCIQNWTITEIMAREKCGLLAVPRTAPVQLTRYVYTKMCSQQS